MAEHDIPNTVLGRFLTLEMLGMVVLTAVAWGALTTRVASLEDHQVESDVVVAKNTLESRKITDELSAEINQINRKVDVLGNNQDHFKRQIEGVDGKLERIQTLLERRAVSPQ